MTYIQFVWRCRAFHILFCLNVFLHGMLLLEDSVISSKPIPISQNEVCGEASLIATPSQNDITPKCFIFLAGAPQLKKMSPWTVSPLRLPAIGPLANPSIKKASSYIPYPIPTLSGNRGPPLI